MYQMLLAVVWASAAFSRISGRNTVARWPNFWAKKTQKGPKKLSMAGKN
jgi:hypothetical protein